MNSFFTMTLKEVIENDYPLPWREYPIFDENHRETLNQKILDKYLFEEIGLETPELFAHYMGARLRSIMPYYNELYKTTLIEFDPLATSHIDEIYSRLESNVQKDVSNFVNMNDTNEKGVNDSYQHGKSSNETLHDGNTTDESDRTDKTISKETENGNSNTKQTDDFTQTTDGTREVNERITRQNNNSQKFYDAPQTQLSSTTPGYLTTQTDDNGSSTENRDTNETAHETQTNKGTRNTDGTTSKTTNGEVDYTSGVKGSGTNKFNENGKSEEYQNGLQTHQNESQNKAVGNTDSLRNAKAKSNYDRTMHGRTGANPSQLLNDFRNNIVNIDEMIVNSLSDLFMGVYYGR